MSGLTVPLIRWTHPGGISTMIHVADDRSWGAWTLCGLKVPPRTTRLYRSTEPLALVREYDVCQRCRRSFGIPLTATNPHRRRGGHFGKGPLPPVVEQLKLGS